MGDLQPVRPPSALLSGHGVLIGGLVVVALLLAMLKPWGTGDAPTTIAEATATPTPSPTPTAPPQNGYSDLEYDPTIFGDTEPPAVWGLWPTGYLVTFGFVSQIPDDPTGSSPPSSASASSSPTPRATADGGPTWPARFDVPNGSHLLLVGIDMPRGFTVESARLQQVAADGSLVSVAVERFPSPWPAHFAVVGLPLRAGDRHLEVWPPGEYRLSLTFVPGGIRRSMEIVIGPLSGAP
jgi:hypothetical protein